MIGVPEGGMCGRHSYSTSPRSSAHSRDLKINIGGSVVECSSICLPLASSTSILKSASHVEGNIEN